MCDFRNNSTVAWDELGDIGTGRPNLGEMVPVQYYRLLQYSIRHVLEIEHGKDFADRILYESGRLVGEKFCKEKMNTDSNLMDFFTELKKKLIEEKIGILRVEKADTDKMEFTLTVAEDLDCSGLPVVDKVVCNYDEGFIAGIMKVYTGKNFNVKEVDCWGIGDRVCRFNVNNPKLDK